MRQERRVRIGENASLASLHLRFREICNVLPNLFSRHLSHSFPSVARFEGGRNPSPSPIPRFLGLIRGRLRNPCSLAFFLLLRKCPRRSSFRFQNSLLPLLIICNEKGNAASRVALDLWHPLPPPLNDLRRLFSRLSNVIYEKGSSSDSRAVFPVDAVAVCSRCCVHLGFLMK